MFFFFLREEGKYCSGVFNDFNLVLIMMIMVLFRVILEIYFDILVGIFS